MLSFIGLLIYQAWMQDYGVKPTASTEHAQVENISPQSSDTLPDVSANKKVESNVPSNVPDAYSVNAKKIHVQTDLLNLVISTIGGTVESADLLAYPVSLETPDVKFKLLTSDNKDFYVSQSGLLSSEKDKAPSHDSIYSVAGDNFQLEDGKDSVEIPLVWKSPDGVEVTKRIVLHRGSYLIDVIHEVKNNSASEWAGRDYGQLQRTKPENKSTGLGGTYTYTGGVYYTPADKYEKIDFDKMSESPLSVDSEEGWLAMIQHYFLSAWIPPKEQMEHYYSKGLSGGKYLLGSYSPAFALPAGSTHQFERKLYLGPKIQNDLEKIAQGLELTVDYGWLTVIAKPIFWLLSYIHKVIGNWGWSIIILTVLIKLAFYKLSETSYKSMAHMRKVTPRMQALKDRYGDDKQRLNQAMMELYKKEKINPLGGCLPILVQIPVFIALYWVLLESIELRQAPFILWLNNLSDKDPYFVLPVIMGISMLVQQKLNPTPPDPMQAKIMMSLPFIFTVFFAFFPSGLVLYWVVNNLLSILQQWYITRKIVQSDA